MFLNQLNQENKELFLKICVLGALSNGDFKQQEKEIILAYCHEMNIPENIPECNESLEQILKNLGDKTSDVEKNIILLEVMGLIKSDGFYDEKEITFINSLVKNLNIKEEVLSKITSLLETYTTVCNELYSTIFEVERNYI